MVVFPSSFSFFLPLPSLPPLFPLSLPLSLLSPSSLPPLSLFPFSLPLSLPLSSLPPPPLQGDEPLNSDDDDEDSDGEGAHFDTEDNIVCQFEKVRCSPGYCGDQHPSTVLLCAILGFSHEQTSKLVMLRRAWYLKNQKAIFHYCSTNCTSNTWCV